MKVGDLVRYKKSNSTNTDVGIIVVDGGVEAMLIQWNSGIRQWRHTSILEMISESR